MNLRSSLLTLVGSPDRAFLTLMIGALLMYRELVRPGRVIPGVAGAVGVLTALWALASYKLDWRGIALVTAGLMLILLQGIERWAWMPGIAGALCLFTGARFAVAAPWRISWAASAIAIPFAAISIYLLRTAVRARRNKTRMA